MIAAIWPQYKKFPNKVPVAQGATSSDFLSFFLFWLLQLPFIFIHPSKLKWVFNIKAMIVPIVAIGTLIWVSRDVEQFESVLTTRRLSRLLDPRLVLSSVAAATASQAVRRASLPS